VDIPIGDDNVTEPEEDFPITLVPDGGDPDDPSNPTVNVTITDDDRVTIGFERDVYPIREDQGSVEVCARVLMGRLARSVTVFLETRDLTAQGRNIAVSIYIALVVRCHIFFYAL